MSRTPRLFAVGCCVALSACATMVNRGKVRSVVPEGGGNAVRVARVELRNVRGGEGLLHFLVPGELTVYVGGRQVPIHSADSADNASRWRARCRLGASDGDTRQACDNAIFYPYLELDKSVAHTLRLVRADGREATVTVRPRMRIGWIWANGVWFAAAPLGWAVDAVSGKWTYFGSIDVGRAFSDPRRVASSGALR